MKVVYTEREKCQCLRLRGRDRVKETGYRDKHTEKERERAASLLLGASWLFMTRSCGGCLCECKYVCCGGLGVGIETVYRKRQFQAELCWQTLSAHFLCAARHAGTRTHTPMHTHSHRVAAGQGACLESGPTKRESEGRRHGGKERGWEEGVQQRAALSHSLGI